MNSLLSLSHWLGCTLSCCWIALSDRTPLVQFGCIKGLSDFFPQFWQLRKMFDSGKPFRNQSGFVIMLS